jgi:hypothetical protein
MLSLRRRQEEGGAVFRARGMADDVELEEGEACSDYDDGALGFVDPDVALSYIVSTPLQPALVSLSPGLAECGRAGGLRSPGIASILIWGLYPIWRFLVCWFSIALRRGAE